MRVCGGVRRRRHVSSCLAGNRQEALSERRAVCVQYYALGKRYEAHMGPCGTSYQLAVKMLDLGAQIGSPKAYLGRRSHVNNISALAASPRKALPGDFVEGRLSLRWETPVSISPRILRGNRNSNAGDLLGCGFSPNYPDERENRYPWKKMHVPVLRCLRISSGLAQTRQDATSQCHAVIVGMTCGWRMYDSCGLAQDRQDATSHGDAVSLSLLWECCGPRRHVSSGLAQNRKAANSMHDQKPKQHMPQKERQHKHGVGKILRPWEVPALLSEGCCPAKGGPGGVHRQWYPCPSISLRFGFPPVNNEALAALAGRAPSGDFAEDGCPREQTYLALSALDSFHSSHLALGAQSADWLVLTGDFVEVRTIVNTAQSMEEHYGLSFTYQVVPVEHYVEQDDVCINGGGGKPRARGATMWSPAEEDGDNTECFLEAIQGEPVVGLIFATLNVGSLAKHIDLVASLPVDVVVVTETRMTSALHGDVRHKLQMKGLQLHAGACAREDADGRPI